MLNTFFRVILMNLQPGFNKQTKADRHGLPVAYLCLSLLLLASAAFGPKAGQTLTGSVSLHRVNWTEPVECLDFNVPGSRSLCCPNGAALRHLLLLLSESARLLARLLRRERPLIGVELGLSPDVDPILRRSGIHVIQFPLVLHGRAPALG